MLSPQQEQALDAVAPACIACEPYAGPAIVTCAQWAIETQWGLHMPPHSNNPFGIKQYPGCSGRVLAATREWFTPAQLRQFLSKGDGRVAAKDPKKAKREDGAICYIVKDWFATFPTFEDAFRYRTKLLQKSANYSNALKVWNATQDPEQFIDELGKWSTDEDYIQTLKDLAFGPAITRAINQARTGEA